MDTLLHGLAIGAALLLLIAGGIGFWRGLSLKPNDPSTRARQSHAGGLLGLPWW